MSAPPAEPSLYDRLGGIYSIACVVDDFIDRIMSDPRLNANPAVNEAHHKVLPPGFKYLVTEMVGWATGGSQKYTGRSMRESHQHLNVTPNEWGGVHGRFSTNARQVHCGRQGTRRTKGNRQQHLRRHRDWQIVAD